MCKSKYLVMLLAFTLALSSLLAVGSVSAQLRAVPEFTLKYVDKSYDIPPTATSSTNPYTGNVTTSTIPGYHISYKTIEVKITNNIGASYYALRYRGHYSNTWTYFPYNTAEEIFISDGFFPPPFQASNSSYTIGDLYLDRLPQPIPDGAPIDVQVQALFGNFDVTPYVHAIDVGGPTYDATFKGTTGQWSNTQTINLPATQTPASPASPTPTTPEISMVAILLLLTILPFVILGIWKKVKI